MACSDCERRKIEENVDGLYQDIGEVERVQKNHAYVLIALAVIVCILLVRLNDKGILSYRDFLEAPVG
jgi:hypothetical protein